MYGYNVYVQCTMHMYMHFELELGILMSTPQCIILIHTRSMIVYKILTEDFWKFQKLHSGNVVNMPY